MKGHFQRATWPLTATAAFFGLALIEYPLGKPRTFLSLIYATVTVSMQLGIYIIFIMLSNSIMNAIYVGSVFHVMMFCCNFIILTATCLTHWHGKRYYKCIERFNQVDETLKDLGIETDYSKLRSETLLTLFMWAAISILLTMYTYINSVIKYPDKQIVLFLLSMDMPLHICVLSNIQYWSVLRYSATRFDYISSVLRKLTINDNNYTSCFRNTETIQRGFVLDERARHFIWTAMHLHFELCGILRDISAVFEIQMSLQMGFDCVFLLCNFVFVFRLILSPSQDGNFKTAIEICLWILPFLADVIVTNHLCETVSAKAKTICNTAVQLLRCMDDEGMREDVSFIVLQTKLRPLKFSCLGLYYFGYDFIYEMFGSIVTTAVIILQLKVGLES